MSEEQIILGQEIKTTNISLAALTESYKPDVIFFREKQMNEIENLFCKSQSNYVDHDEDKSWLLLQGYSGSGKTVATLKVLERHPGKYIFATASDNPTALLLLKSIFGITATTLGTAIQKSKDILRHTNKVLVIDEINKLRNQDEIRIFFNALNTIWREVPYPAILITNKIRFLENIPDDAKSTFFPERIDFNPYNAEELYGIINPRIEIIKKANPSVIIDDGDIRKAAAYITLNFDGSVRSLFKLVRRCLIQNDFSDEFFYVVCNRLIMGERIQELKAMSQYERKFLRLIRSNIHFLKNPLMESLTNIITVSDTEERDGIYFDELVKLSHYSRGRVSQLIKHFEDYYGLIQSENKNAGRAGGRSKIISFVSDEEENLVNNFLDGDALWENKRF